MTDAISRSALLNTLDELIKLAKRHESDDAEYAMTVAAAYVQDAPALDVAPVVRCEDCEHYDSVFRFCELLNTAPIQPDFFCADGVRDGGDSGAAD